MRRGHPGIGGWRNENQKNFRPRSAGTPQFRPPRTFSLLDVPRYPPPGPRAHRPPPFYPRRGHPDSQGPSDHHDRDYRGRQNSRPDRSHHHDSRHYIQRARHNDPSAPYNDNANFYEDSFQPGMPCRINSMGDVDHRLPLNLPQKKDLFQHQAWANPPHDNNRHYYDQRNNVKDPYPHSASIEGNRIGVLDSSAHRPPSSDHYGSTTRSTVENNDVFSHSVNDTVDIVRKKLLNRNDPHRLSSEQPNDNNFTNEEDNQNRSSSFENVQLQQTPKRKVPQQQQMKIKKSDCDKVKNKIVHTFFKMNKGGIHKLMDDPSSSAKFEYAISSFIMETQNSLNRHQRSAAEKSLYRSSTDFIHSEENTAYEDTFMKQMQYILDPQDTVLLEDIKPVIMAEMSKVLRLENTEYLDVDNPVNFQPSEGNPIYDCYPNDNYFDENPCYDETDNIEDGEVDVKYDFNKQTDYVESKPLYQRRPSRKSIDQNQYRRESMENHKQARSSFDKPINDNSAEHLPLFDSNTEVLSDEDDPFAELDKQYHVAVDHNFIENDYLSNSEPVVAISRKSPVQQIPNLQSADENLFAIKKEIDDQLQNIAKSPLKLFSPPVKVEPTLNSSSELQINVEHDTQHCDSNKNNDVATLFDTGNNENKATCNVNRTQESHKKTKDQTEKKNQVSSATKTSNTTSNTRKRSSDQKPSHRKEKRKKSESSPANVPHQTMDKYLVNSTVNSIVDSSETQNPDPSTIERKDDKNRKNTDKNYSDKYVKRKEPQKKSKEKEAGPKKRSISTSHSHTSPTDANNTVTNSQIGSKDGKVKLKPIDMFIGQPKKLAVHQSHRNTAVSTPVGVTPKPVEEPKAKQLIPSPSKINKKCAPGPATKKVNTKETQTIQRKFISRICQTEKKNMVTKAIQTDPVSIERPKSQSNDTFERMKEIDLEIQVLLQEKFKLYSSLESKDNNQSSLQTLGMTVLNVPLETKQDEDAPDNLSEDAIVNEFTSIPVEELEQIAFESVDNDNCDTMKGSTRTRRSKILQQERKQSESPSNSAKRNNRKAKGPNISLIEQIITDDRPLEDIISLDDLEEIEKPPPRNRKKTIKAQALKKKVNKKPKSKLVPETTSNNLKECSVVLLREDLSKYSRAMSVESENTQAEEIEEVLSIEEVPTPPPPDELYVDMDTKLEMKHNYDEVVEESVMNDLQFDMLDVSEDIVIGDDNKCDDRDRYERVEVPICEEIILDNSQSSMEDMAAPEQSQEENECRMFDYSTDDNLRRDSVLVSGHADAVLAIECIDNDFIAACLDGNVYHFDGDGRLVNTLRGSNLAVTCLTIVREPHGTTVYTGSLDSRIRYYDLETGLEKGPECNVLSPIQTMDRAWDTVFVGTRTGFVLQFECKNNMLIPVSTVKFSEQSILALRALKEGPRKVLLVAARSENVTIKDAQTGLLLRTLQGPKMTVYTLLFEDGKVYCGTSTHQIHVFDYASGGHVGAHSGGKGAVCLRATGGLVFAGCYDGCVYIYREGQARPLAQLRGPSLMLLSLAVRGSKIIAGYKDRSLYIWKIPLVILQEMIL